MSGDYITVKLEKVLSRLPLSAIWLWFALFLFCLHNQHHHDSIIEDATNKPWRPLAAKWITIAQTDRFIAISYPVWYFVSWKVGAMRQGIVLTCLSIYYNEFGGSELGGFSRNILNASGYSCFFAGALQGILGQEYDVYNPKAALWLLMVCLMIFTTIHVQDFRDEEGDMLRGRKTVQTLLGDAASRWVVIMAAFFWSSFIPAMLGLDPESMLICCLFASVMSFFLLRCLWLRTVARDIQAYRAWCFWIMSILLSPWIHTAFCRLKLC